MSVRVVFLGMSNLRLPSRVRPGEKLKLQGGKSNQTPAGRSHPVTLQHGTHTSTFDPLSFS